MDVSKLKNDATSSAVSESRLSGAQGTSSARKTQRSADASAIQGSGKIENSEKVALSPEARLLSEGVDAVRMAPTTRADKVAELKAQIKAGTYNVDPKAVAEKMIQSSLEDDILTRME
jgi:flagellar biosynthesis anti-sigma factor FlgM